MKVYRIIPNTLSLNLGTHKDILGEFNYHGFEDFIIVWDLLVFKEMRNWINILEEIVFMLITLVLKRKVNSSFSIQKMRL